MKNFKAAYDAVQTAILAVDAICDKMEAAYGAQDEAEVEKALAMVPELEAAQKRADELRAAYDLMTRPIVDEKSPASRFVPAGEGAKAQAEGAKTLSRAEWNELTPQAKHEFFRNGGRLVDEAAE